MTAIEQRIFRIGALMVAAGTILCGSMFGVRQGISFLAGGTLSGLSLAWLRATVNAIAFSDRRRSTVRVVGSFILRLVLIPLSLYAIIRFLYLGIIAAVAGFAIFNCSVFIEGLYEALRKSKDDPGSQ